MSALLMGSIYEVYCSDGLWHDMHNIFHDDQFMHLGDIKVIAAKF
jgi:hypothetical protein